MQGVWIALVGAALLVLPGRDLDRLWDYSAPAASESRFQELLASPEARDPEYRLEILTQIARAQGLQGQYAKASATLAEVERAPAKDRPPVVQVRTLLEQGRVLNSSGKPLAALPVFQRALDLARETGLDVYAADAAHMLALAAPTAKEKIRWNLEGTRIASQSSDPAARRWLGPIYNNLGWVYHDAGDFEPALTSFCHALEAYEAAGKPGPIRIARWTLARGLRSLGRLDEALEHQEALAEELRLAGEKDGYVEEELAELHLKLHGLRQARPHAARAYELLRSEDWLDAKRLERLRILGGKARLTALE